MKTHAREGVALDKGVCFLFCSSNNLIAEQLGRAVADLGLLIQESLSVDTLAGRLVEIKPQVVFLDFAADESAEGRLLQSADLARVLARVAPSIPRIAVGSLAQPSGAIAALRAGVSDFVDPAASPEEAAVAVRRLVEGRRADPGDERRSVLLLGARPGVGTSTLAVHLAGMMQERLGQAASVRQHAAAGKPVRNADAAAEQMPLSRRVGILDLGYPIGDCLLYLNLGSDFDFVEGVRNLSRLDGTLLDSALAHTASGISALALPRDLSRMHAVSPADSLMLVERLRQHCSMLLTDAGGCPDLEFVAKLARASSEVWIVTDQSVSALVALADLLRELERKYVDKGMLRLVVNRYDERYGMGAGQIAARFGLALAGVLPDRTLPLMSSLNQGRLLHEQTERDIYVRSVQQLVDHLTAASASPGLGARASGWLANWLPGVHKRMTLL